MTRRHSLMLPFGGPQESVESRIDARDRQARAHAVDPRYNVALEASAGTGKTRVLVDRYVNLLRAGVEPANILAITFTRKAAAEMRERIVGALQRCAAAGEILPARWRELRDRLSDIAISTIDAFCLSLLREFPLEADLDPDFSVADETEVPRLVDESLDRALRVCRRLAKDDPQVSLVFSQIGERRARAGLAALLNRRLVAPQLLAGYVAGAPPDLSIDRATARAASAVVGVLQSMPGGLDRFQASGPVAPSFEMLSRSLTNLAARVGDRAPIEPSAMQLVFAGLRGHFLTRAGEPRNRLSYPKTAFASERHWQAHRDLVIGHADAVRQAVEAYRRDVNVLVARGVGRMFHVANSEYRRTLDAQALLDFADVLTHALALLRQMDEFARSRYRLESRYHHLLVDEFQDTSRAQWELISLLIQSWDEGAGLAEGPLPPSVFIVGDRKQSIYGFRDADVSILREASRHLEALRPQGSVRRSISRSFRAVPALLSFVNDICVDINKAPGRSDAFEYEEEDRFPTDDDRAGQGRGPGTGAGGCGGQESLGMVSGQSIGECAEASAEEIARLLAGGALIRDRGTGIRRPLTAGDIAILFRSRESHREFESALERRGIGTYVYKGLGFFDTDEVKDVLVLLRYLADPLSDLRAAAFLRSRFVRLSDQSLQWLAPSLADALRSTDAPAALARLDPSDAETLVEARESARRWRRLVDRVPPGELLDLILSESAYAVELRGARFLQARENLKKLRALIRRIQNRGYTTMERLTANLDRLGLGDEANAVIDAVDAVSLMTIHASKGLEFPVVFIVHIGRGTGNRRDAIRVSGDASGGSVSVAVGDFQSEADDDRSGKDCEETKRLLYVALTRARDRLYLAAVTKEGRLQPGRGSLAEVLPESFISLFAHPSGASTIEWAASSGIRHHFQLCPMARDAERPASECRSSGALESDYSPLVDRTTPRVTVLDAAMESESAEDADDGEGQRSDRLVGALVHRLLQQLGFDAERLPEDLVQSASRLLRPHEAETTDIPSAVDAAVAAYRAIRGRADLRAVYATGNAFHEVPFTMPFGSSILRGAIDCLVVDPSGKVTIVEIKTGRSRRYHAAQLDLYRRAAQELFPGAAIDTLLIYAAGNPAGSHLHDRSFHENG